MMSDDNKNNENNSPVEDDFDVGGGTDRLIRGEMLRYVDGHWATRDGISFPTGTQMLVIGTTQALQHWHDGMPIETITARPLPSVDDLNAAIPKEDWEDGLNGPRPPWVLQHVVYLIDPRDASTFTFINSTVGAAIAVERLTSKVRAMRLLRGAKVVPVVALDHRPMPTKFGQKLRPEFNIVEFRDLGCGGIENKQVPQLLPANDAKQIGKPVKPVTTAEELNDELPF
jgi:hypothetical protein